MKIQLNLISDINEFIQGCQYYTGEIEITQGRQVVDAKSTLGVYSLDLSQPIDVHIHTDRTDVAEDFYKFLAKWEVKSIDD